MPDRATRLELLRLTKPEGIANPDTAMWIARATELENWLEASEAGQATPAPDAPAESQTTKDRTRVKAPRQPVSPSVTA
jgi:hypothetical protein